MKQDLNLIAELREDQGKGASRRLRREGKVPAIIYGGGRPPRMLAFDHNRVIQQLEHESFFSSILTIKVGDKNQAAIVKDIQRHPAKNRIMHMDFQRIVDDEKIRMKVPIHYLNADTSIGVKKNGGSVSQLITDIEVSCLPKDLPEYFEVDIAELDLNLQPQPLQQFKRPAARDQAEGNAQPTPAPLLLPIARGLHTQPSPTAAAEHAKIT